LEERLKQAEIALQAQQKKQINTYLDTHAPGWREKNKSDEFISDSKTTAFKPGVFMLQALQEAYANGDGPTCAQVFNLWNPGPAPQTHKSTAPGQHVPTPKPAYAAGWTPQMIEKLYRDYSQKRISADDFKRLEAEMHQALNSGRVR
jgi:hypothetical protein